MKIAAAAYPIDWHNRWNDYVGKLRVWVRTAAEQGAELLVFPEHGALELASLAGEENARDLARTIEALTARIKDVDDLHAQPRPRVQAPHLRRLRRRCGRATAGDGQPGAALRPGRQPRRRRTS